jgi:hypothetical protein
MISYKVTVTDERQILVAADDTHRTVYLHHDTDADIVYIGGANVSTDNGFHLHKLDTLSIVVPSRQTLYAVKDDSGDPVDVWVLCPDLDA